MTKQFISFPIMKNRTEMIGTIQVESKLSVQDIAGDQNTLAVEKIKAGIRHYQGFGMIDRIVLSIIKECL